MLARVREFRQLLGKTVERYWRVWLEDDLVCCSWGAIVNGKHKEHGETRDRPGPKGKVGTKNYVDSLANAQFNMERAIRKKLEEGYIEVDPEGKPLTEDIVISRDIDWSRRLPKNFCFSKPRSHMPGDLVAAMEQAGDLILTRKVNGMSVVVQVLETEEVIAFSRRMDYMTTHFPHLIDAIYAMRIPPKTVMLFEAFMGEGKSRQDLMACARIMHCKAELAVARQRNSGWMNFYLYRLPFWKGEHIESRHTNEEWLYLIENTFADRFIEYRDQGGPNRPPLPGRFLYTVDIFEGTIAEAMALAEAEQYEGWVCYQRSAFLGKYSYSFDGKANRPACAFKMKREVTDDFIAYWEPDNSRPDRPMGTWGTGKNRGSVGSLSLYQLNTRGQEVYICDVAGFTDEEREQLSKIRDWPICVEVEYTSRSYKSRGEKSNALEFPRFVRIRQDKSWEECVDYAL